MDAMEEIAYLRELQKENFKQLFQKLKDMLDLEMQIAQLLASVKSQPDHNATAVITKHREQVEASNAVAREIGKLRIELDGLEQDTLNRGR
jgi:hypothetical protein